MFLQDARVVLQLHCIATCVRSALFCHCQAGFYYSCFITPDLRNLFWTLFVVQVLTGSRCLPKTSLVMDIHNDLTEVPKEETAGSHFYFAIGLEGVSPYIFVSFLCFFCLDPPRTPRDAYLKSHV